MGLMDIFKATENEILKQQIQQLQNDNALLQTKVSELSTPEYQNFEVLREKSDKLNLAMENIKKSLSEIKNEIDAKRAQIIQLDDEILLQEVGFYRPMFAFTSSSEYKEKLSEIREQQKWHIQGGYAVSSITSMTLNGSEAEGKKLIKDVVKQALRCFNTECDMAVDKVKFNNIDKMEQRIFKSAETINKLNVRHQIVINKPYFDLKIQELHLAYEYQVKKQEEKEQLKLLREEQREEAKLQKELEEARKNIYKDQKHYHNALGKYKAQLDSVSDDDQKANLLEKIAEVETHLSELDQQLQDVDYRQNNQKAGYVYVISNIGSFGSDVYKIGMTRRLEPMERIDELGDASVPFNFDVHAMIFTEDAPALEGALHKAFENRKVNMINGRREFFNVTLKEIEDVIKANFDKTVEFVEVAEAQQFRESLLLKSST